MVRVLELLGPKKGIPKQTALKISHVVIVPDSYPALHNLEEVISKLAYPLPILFMLQYEQKHFLSLLGACVEGRGVVFAVFNQSTMMAARFLS